MKKKDLIKTLTGIGAAGKIGYAYSTKVVGDFVIPQYWITFSNGTRLLFEKSSNRSKVYKLLIKMGYERDLNLSSDEMDGLSEVGKNGVTWGEPTILSR